MGERYNYAVEKQLADAMGGYLYDTSAQGSVRRRIGLLEEYFSENMNLKAWFYGFAQSESENAFTNIFDYTANGETGICKPFDLMEIVDGYTVIGYLEDYAATYNKNYTNGYDIYYGAAHQFEVTYRFPSDFTLKKIMYSKEVSSGGEFTIAETGEGDNVFIGSVSVRNPITGDFVNLFSSGQEIVIDNIEDYLNADGSLTLNYNIDTYDAYDINNYCLPKVKLAGCYD